MFRSRRSRTPLKVDSPVVTSSLVIEHGVKVNLIAHLFGGEWIFHCSPLDGQEDELCLVHFGELMANDPTLSVAFTLARGDIVFRGVDGPWRTQHFFSDDDFWELLRSLA